MGLESENLARFALGHGAARVECFGGDMQEPYIQEASTDLLLIAERA